MALVFTPVHALESALEVIRMISISEFIGFLLYSGSHNIRQNIVNSALVTQEHHDALGYFACAVAGAKAV